jgi:hypothetical protein
MVTFIDLENKTLDALYKAESYRAKCIKGDFTPEKIEVRVIGTLKEKDSNRTLQQIIFGSEEL